MSAMPIPKRSEFIEDSLLLKPSVEAPAIRPDRKTDRFMEGRRSLGKLALLDKFALLNKLDPIVFARYLIAFFIGVIATLASQSYGGATKEMIAPAAPPHDRQQLNTISLDLEALRQGIDRIVTSVATSQEQMTRRIERSIDRLADGQEQTTRGITELQRVEQYVLDRISTLPTRPAPTTVSKPVLRSPQAPLALTPARNP